MAFYTIRPKSGTKAQWEQANPVLREREIGFEYPDGGLATGLVKMKMGDGTTAWKSLPYAIVGQEEFDITDHLEDSLTSTATDKALTANQGKILKDGMDEIIEDLGDIKVWCGTAVRNFASNGMATLFTRDTVNEKLGIETAGGNNIAVFVANGDMGSYNHVFYSAGYNGSANEWRAFASGNYGGNARINFMCVYFPVEY